MQPGAARDRGGGAGGHPLELLGLLRRAERALHRAGIHTVEALAQAAGADLREIRGIGRGAVAQIQCALAGWPEQLDAGTVRGAGEPTLAEALSLAPSVCCDDTDIRALGVSEGRISWLLKSSRGLLRRQPLRGAIRPYLDGLRGFIAERGGLVSFEEIEAELPAAPDLGAVQPLAACALLAAIEPGFVCSRRLRLLAERDKPLAHIRLIRRTAHVAYVNGGSIPLAEAVARLRAGLLRPGRPRGPRRVPPGLHAYRPGGPDGGRLNAPSGGPLAPVAGWGRVALTWSPPPRRCLRPCRYSTSNSAATSRCVPARKKACTAQCGQLASASTTSPRPAALLSRLR